MNKVFLLGNLGADPDLRQTKGDPVLSMRLATSRVWYDRNDKKQEDVQWHSVSIWGKRAEGLAKILSKGDRILVEGEIHYREYEKDGERKFATEIKAFNIELCGGSGGSGREREGRGQREERGERRSGSDRGERRYRGREERERRPARDDDRDSDPPDENPDWGFEPEGDVFGSYGDS
jgi:single-strand DNA-binding protein